MKLSPNVTGDGKWEPGGDILEDAVEAGAEQLS